MSRRASPPPFLEPTGSKVPTQSRRHRFPLPAAVQGLPTWTRAEFLQSEKLRSEVIGLVLSAGADGELADGADSELGAGADSQWLEKNAGPLAQLLAQLFAHLEPLPSQLWITAVGETKLARNSWLAGYRLLRHAHRDWDRGYAKLDRKQSAAVHPQLWRRPEWREMAHAMIFEASKVTPLKAHKRGVVSRIARPSADGLITPKASAGSECLILKHFPPHKKVDPRNSLGLSKAIFSLHASEALNRRGLRAAVGYAAWSLPKQGSWMLLEDLAGFEALQDVLLTIQGTERAAVLAKLARYARRMHLLGVAYRDFKPSNILLRYAAADDVEIALIDHDRNRFRSDEIRPWRARRDLAALHAGLPAQVRASERLRALRIYGGPWREHLCDWGYRGDLWDQQIPKLVAEAIRRDRLWKARRLLAGNSQTEGVE
ncbi:MAG: hypothetical protein HQ519_02940 [Planctomycetes bacterium]|nr:hypothetical protein [Planctomycetota bacterium]